MNSNNIYWVGIRKSDLLSIDSFYKGSITYFGDDQEGNISLFKAGIARRNHNNSSPIFLEFIRTSMLNIINDNSEARFMFYNPTMAYFLEKELRQRVICLNSVDLLKTLDDKILCKLWLKEDVHLLKNIQLFGREIYLESLRCIFNGQEEFIIQSPVSSGGAGTYIFTEKNHKEIEDNLIPEKIYTVSPYFRNAISINTHCIILKKTFLIYPFSIQIIAENTDNLLYKGCDFIAAQDLDSVVKTQLVEQSKSICKKLCENNYLGVCGIDFMLIDGKIYFSEINPRFQASTAVLNYALHQNNLMSINEANFYAFTDELQLPAKDSNIDVNYSLYTYDEDAKYSEFNKNIFQTYFKLHPENEVLKDGYFHDIDAEHGAYLFRAIYIHSIVDIHNNETHINELFSGYRLESPVDPLKLKIMLLNFGVKLSPAALLQIQKKGKLREANFSAIDIVLWDDVIINCPYKINQTEYSPFTIELDNKQLVLYYFKRRLINIKIFYESILNSKKTSSGVPYSSVAFLATDRLRINYNSVCYYKKNQLGCQFCNLPDCNHKYNFDDIIEITDDYLKNETFRHILIGGGSSNPKGDFKEIIKLTKFLKSKTDKMLYLMSTPPEDLSVIWDLFNAGISEIAFNMEIFNQSLAEFYMPGKGKILREHYYMALQEAVSLFGKTGNVKSMIILGLEPEKSLLSGIERLCQIGVQPMISIFRPMPYTPLSNRIPLSCNEIFNLYDKINTICKKYGQTLGPSCIYCQNNTLALPSKYNNIKIGEYN